MKLLSQCKESITSSQGKQLSDDLQLTNSEISKFNPLVPLRRAKSSINNSKKVSKTPIPMKEYRTSSTHKNLRTIKHQIAAMRSSTPDKIGGSKR